MTIARKLSMAASVTSVDPDTPDTYWQGSNWAWWDLSDFGSLWQDTARTTAVTAVGQDVKAIDDRSGNGYHQIWAAGTVPTLAEDGNGKKYIAFDGTNSFAINMTAAVGSKNNISLFTAFEKGVAGDGPVHGWGYTGVTNIDAVDAESDNDVRFAKNFTGTNLTVDINNVCADGEIFRGGYISEPDFTAYSSDTIAFYDSVQHTSGITDPSGTTITNNTNFYIGQFNSSNFWAGGNFYGAILGSDIFTSNTDTDEVLALVNGTNEYLAWLTGTTYSEIGSIT